MRANIASIQFLRFVAATLVVLFHTFQALNRYLPGSIAGTTQYAAGFGESGVHIFFVISGFVMVYTSFNDPARSFSTSAFLSRRFIRIYPIYFIYAALYLAFYELVANGKTLTLAQLIGSLLLLPGYSSLIIGPGWTLSFEIYFYCWFGALMVLGLTRGLVLLTTLFLAFIALRFALGSVNDTLHVFTNPLLIEFLLGAWIGYIVISGVKVSTATAATMVVASVAGFAAGTAYGYHRAPAVVMWALPSALLVGGFVFAECIGRMPRIVRRLSFLGDSSYSLYLLHILLIDAVIFLTMRMISSAHDYSLWIGTSGMIIIGLVIAACCIGISTALYELVERRLVIFLQNFYRRRVAMAGRLP